MTIKKIMSYNGVSNEVTFYAGGVELYTTTEPDIAKAHELSNTIQQAYSRGVAEGRHSLLRQVEQNVRELEQ